MLKKVIFIGVIASIIALYKLGYLSYLSNINNLKALLDSTGNFQYLVFIIIFIFVALFSIHSSLLAIVAGLIYGPILGGILSLIGAFLGALIAFIIARYLFNDYIVNKYQNNDFYIKIMDGFNKNGNDYLIMTRLVIIFPYNIQNYLYGLTNIKFSTYALITFICIIPGTFLYTFLAQQLNNASLDFNSFIKLLIVSILFTALIILPKKYFSRKGRL